ncbi:UNVERIFIED_ORG: hypothetical protein QFZ59_001569 [Bacillus sp. B2I3]|nr:hypothetical protein [Bacillus sp. B2I3]
MAVNGEENDSKQTDNKEVSEIKMKFRKETHCTRLFARKTGSSSIGKTPIITWSTAVQTNAPTTTTFPCIRFWKLTLSRYEIYGSVYVK